MNKAEARAEYLHRLLDVTDCPMMLVVVGCDRTREVMTQVLARHLENGRVEIIDVEQTRRPINNPQIVMVDDWMGEPCTVAGQQTFYENLLKSEISFIKMYQGEFSPEIDERPARHKGKGKCEKDWEQSHYRKR